MRILNTRPSLLVGPILTSLVLPPLSLVAPHLLLTDGGGMLKFERYM